MSRPIDWIELAHSPANRFATPLKINASEFIIVPQKAFWRNHACQEGIYRYNLNDNKWSKIINYPNDYYCYYHDTVFDPHKQILYIFGKPNNSLNCLMIEIDYKTKKIIKHKKSYYVGDEAQMTFIDEHIHIIGGGNNNTHSVWNKIKEEFEIIHTFSEFSNGLQSHRLLQLPSKHSVLLCGGEDDNLDNQSDAIYEFSFKANKWQKWTVKLPNPLCSFGIVSTKNDNFVIILGGTTGFEQNDDPIYTDDIFIFDTQKKSFIKSVIKCPIKITYYALIMEDENKDKLLTFGYVNEFFRSKKGCDLQYLPFYIIMLIKEWVCNEMIYLLDVKRGNHWKISVDEILTSTATKSQ